MTYPNPDATTIFIRLPSEEAIKTVVGDTYDGASMLNVLKMMAGTEDMYAATVGLRPTEPSRQLQKS